jgi:membrane associated rhomboid family serine protease
MVLTTFLDVRFNIAFFAVGHEFDQSSILSWFRLVSHILGHENWPHLFGNFSLILLVGPMLEEKFGSWGLLEMIFVTALGAGVLQLILFPGVLLLGASGVVFMMIILASMSNMKEGEIPATFILVAIIYLGSEFVTAFKPDNISHFTHIFGGLCGAAFGFLLDMKHTAVPE